MDDERERPGVAGPNEDGPARYILCPGCCDGTRDENEADKVPIGHLKRDALYDRCGEPLPVGSGAAAVTFYDRDDNYEPWEHEHLATQ